MIDHWPSCELDRRIAGWKSASDGLTSPGTGEQDQRREGDDDLGDDDAHVGQRVEGDPEALADALQPERGHRPEGGREDRR